MAWPRPTTARLMAFVLLFALDLGAVRAARPPSLLPAPSRVLLVLGCLPTANVLAVALILLAAPTPRDGWRQPGLLGFVLGGSAALGLLLAGVMLRPFEVSRALDAAAKALGAAPGPPGIVLAVALLLLFQLGAGLLGALSARRCRPRKVAPSPRRVN